MRPSSAHAIPRTSRWTDPGSDAAVQRPTAASTGEIGRPRAPGPAVAALVPPLSLRSRAWVRWQAAGLQRASRRP